MSSLLIDIPSWVQEAPGGRSNFRQAIHCVLEAIAHDPHLRELLCMKGGILMALHYDSPRFTNDIDFSTPQEFDTAIESEVVERLKDALAGSPERLGYDLDCRLQSYSVQPSRKGSFVTIEMKIGYATKGTQLHKRLLNGKSPHVVGVDYSFNETIPEVEVVEIEDGSLRVYALPTLVAEKLRSLLQQPIRNRTRRQDVYDLNHLLNERPALLNADCRKAVLDDLKIKCADRGILPLQNSFDDPKIRDLAQANYTSLADELADGLLPPFDEIYPRVVDYYRSLPWA
jgi:predicted nucleotidyltransferase component of viral defense system